MFFITNMDTEIKLPLPDINSDFGLMQALKVRRSARKWNSSELSLQHLSGILWAACGLTLIDQKTGRYRRTAPSACNSKEIMLYVTISSGLYLYNELNHSLIKVINTDLRLFVGTQKMMQKAPVGLIYVSDYSKLNSVMFKNDNTKWFISCTDTAFIGQNVYLYCAANKINTVFLSLVNRQKLHSLMQLPCNKKVIYAQVVGYAATK